MDKYDRILDLAEHPERYSPEQVVELLSDPDGKTFYNTLCKTVSVMNFDKPISDDTVDAEWERVTGEPMIKRRKKLLTLKKRPYSRVASVTTIICTSLAAVALGLSFTISVMDKKPMGTEVKEPQPKLERKDAVNDTIISGESMTAAITPVIFEDTPLKDILDVVSGHYGVELKYNTPEAARLHLYYKFDARRPLRDIVEQLNTFEKINISIDADTLIIE